MSKEEKQEIIDKHAREEWKGTPENIEVGTADNAEDVFKRLETLDRLGYPSEKVVVVFPETYTLKNLEANDSEPEGTIWYILYHTVKSKNGNNIDDYFKRNND